MSFSYDVTSIVPARAYLLLIQPALAEEQALGKRWVLPEQGLIVGNQAGADVLLDAETSTPWQIRFFKEPGESWQFDQTSVGSSVLLNGKETDHAPLEDGDFIQAGSVSFEFLLETGPKFKVYQELERRVRLDQLTLLPNRRAMIEHIDREMARLKRDFKAVFSILLLNLDSFAELNMKFGYDGGDTILRLMARHLKAGLRKHELVGRYGGAEFLILLPGVGAEEGFQVGENLRARLQGEPLKIGATSLSITLSGGLATASYPMSIQLLIQEAEDRLLQAKEAGRNQIIGIEKNPTYQMKLSFL